MVAARSTGGSGPYVEGERVFAPPQGSFDLDWVAALAAERLEEIIGRVVVVEAVRSAWQHVRAGATAADTEQALTACGMPATLARAAAQSTWDFVVAYAVELPGVLPAVDG